MKININRQYFPVRSCLTSLMVISSFIYGVWYLLVAPSMFAMMDTSSWGREKVRVILKSQIIYYRKNRDFAKTIAQLPSYVAGELNPQYREKNSFSMQVQGNSVLIFSMRHERNLFDILTGDIHTRRTSYLGALFILDSNPKGVVCEIISPIYSLKQIQPFVQKNRVVCAANTLQRLEFKMNKDDL
jgi:hypothetical protein